MKHFGIPYQGSKDKIALDLHRQMPGGRRFVDLFGGGFSLSHSALLLKKYEQVLYNDTEPLVLDVIQRAIRGEFNYKNKPEWISREEFFARKDTDGYVKYIWSFSNSGMQYLFGEDVEETKRLGHMSAVYGQDIPWLKIPRGGTPNQRRRALTRKAKSMAAAMLKDKALAKEYQEFKAIKNERSKAGATLAVEFTTWLKSTGITASEINELTCSKMSSHYLCTNIDGQPAIPTVEMFAKIRKSPKIGEVPQRILEIVDKSSYRIRLQQLERLQRLEQLEQLQRLQQLEQLERLQQLERLERLERLPFLQFTCKDYREYEFKEGDVVYCDPPYENTAGYGSKKATFDSRAFYDWVDSRPYPVYFSSYEITDNRFKCIYAVKKAALMSGAGGGTVWERLYVNKEVR